MDCQLGEILRNSYVRKTKTGKIVSVPAGCIRSTSRTGRKMSIEKKQYLKSKKKEHKIAKEMFDNVECPEGMMEKQGYHRSGYLRSSYSKQSRSGSKIKIPSTTVKESWVGPTCIKPSITGRTTHAENIIGPLEKNLLGQYGYEDILIKTKKERKAILNNIMFDNKIPPLSLYRHLVALSTMTKNTNPEFSSTIKQDAEWIKTTKYYKLRPTSRSKSRKR